MPPIVPQKKKQDSGVDPELIKGVAATGLTGAGAYGLRQGYLHTPNRHITVTGGHLKNWGLKKTMIGQGLEHLGMLPAVTHIDDTGAGHLSPAEAYYEELVRHPQVSASGGKDKWIPDTAFRGGNHTNQYHKLAPSRFRYGHSFGTIDTGFGALSNLPPGMDMPGNEFSMNPLGKIFVETDPVPSTSSPNVSAMGALNPSNFHNDTAISTFGNQKRRRIDKVDVNSATTTTGKLMRQFSNLTAGKYKTISHSPDISPLLKDEMINGADNINRGKFTKEQVLQELMNNPALNPQTKALIQQAIDQKKRIALVTGSSRGDYVAQRTNEYAKYLRDTGRNDTQLISVLGERMNPTPESLIANKKIDPLITQQLQQAYAANPNLDLHEFVKDKPEGAGWDTVKDILNTPHTSGIIDDPNVVQLPGLYGDMEHQIGEGAQAKNVRSKLFLALQAVADAHSGSPGASSYNESLMLPGATAIPTDLEQLRQREIEAAEAKGVLRKGDAARLGLVDNHIWNKGTIEQLRNQHSKTMPGIGVADNAEQFFKFMDEQATPQARRARMVRAAKNVLRARMAKRKMVDDHIQYLNKQYGKAKWMSRAYHTGGGLALAAGIPLGLSAISNVMSHHNEHRNQKQGMDKRANTRWVRELLQRQTAAKGNPGLQTALHGFKQQLKGGVPEGKTRLIGKLPGVDETKGQGLLGRGFEGDAMRAFTGGVGDSVLKQHHFQPVKKIRNSGIVDVNPTLTKDNIASKPQTLSPKAYSSGTPIQEKIDLMHANPDLFAKVHHPTPTGYAMEHLDLIDKKKAKLPGSKENGDLKDLIGRLHDKMHWYQKLWTDKDEMYHQFTEGNPKEMWGGRYRQIFGNRTPIDLQDGTSIEDYHLGNTMYNQQGKLIIGDPQLSHRGTMLSRHAAIGGIGAGAAGVGMAGVNALTPDHKGLDGTDAALLGTSAAGGAGAWAANYHTGHLGGMSPLRNRFFGPSLAAAGIPLAMTAGRHMLGYGAEKQSADKTVDRLTRDQLLKDDVNFITPSTKERIVEQIKEESALAKSHPTRAKFKKVLDSGLSGMMYGGGTIGMPGVPIGAALGAGYEGVKQLLHGDKELEEEGKLNPRKLDKQVDESVAGAKDDTGFQLHKALHTGTAGAGLLGLAHMPLNYGINKLHAKTNSKLPELDKQTVRELLAAHDFSPKFKYDENGKVNGARHQIRVNKPHSEKSKGVENAWFSDKKKLSKHDKNLNKELVARGRNPIKKPTLGSVNFTSKKMWRPNILSHELGHADIHREKSLTGFMQRNLYKPTSHPLYGAGVTSATAYATKDDDSVLSGAGKGALIGAAAHAPTLVPEIEASRRGIKAVKKTSLSSKLKGKNALGLALPLATYGLSRIGMNAGVGGLNAFMNKRRNAAEKKAEITHSHTKDQTTIDGKRTIDVLKLIDMSKNLPVKEIHPGELNIPRSKRSGFSQKRLASTDTKHPVLLDKNYELLDGRHRAAKAFINNEMLKYRIVPEKLIRATEIKKAFHMGVLKRASEATGLPLEEIQKMADDAMFSDVNNNAFGQGSNVTEGASGLVTAGGLAKNMSNWVAQHASVAKPINQALSYAAAHPAIASTTKVVSEKAGPVGMALNVGSNLYDYNQGKDVAGAFENQTNRNILPDTGGHIAPWKWNNWGAAGNAFNGFSNPIGAMSGVIRGGMDLGAALGDNINSSRRLASAQANIHPPHPTQLAGQSIKPLNAPQIPQIPQIPQTNATLPPAIQPKPIQPNTATTLQPKARTGGLSLGSAPKPMKPSGSLSLGLGESINHMKFGFELAKLAPVVDDVASIAVQHMAEPEKKEEEPPVKVAYFPHFKTHFENYGEYYTDPGNFTLVNDVKKKQHKSKKKHEKKEHDAFLNKTAGPWNMSWTDLWDLLFGNKKPVDPNANINLKPVKSSNIHSIGYDEPSKTMEVKFNSKGVYRYPNVRKWQYDDFDNAESKGKFFAKHFRQEKDFKKVACLTSAFGC